MPFNEIGQCCVLMLAERGNNNDKIIMIWIFAVSQLCWKLSGNMILPGTVCWQTQQNSQKYRKHKKMKNINNPFYGANDKYASQIYTPIHHLLQAPYCENFQDCRTNWANCFLSDREAMQNSVQNRSI